MIAAEEGAMEKVTKVSKAVARMNKTIEKVDSRLGAVESKSQVNLASSSSVSSQATVTNATKIEQLAADIARVQLSVSEIREQQQLLQRNQEAVAQPTKSGFDLNSSSTGDWFKNKFNAHLKSPESRSYLKDVAESKIRATQVIFFLSRKLTHIEFMSSS